ncbi:hypothetical protein BH23PLA1_BH23PLA1_27110 [soil metagenome]
MKPNSDLIPPPPLVRERLAQHIREGRILRALLRLSVRAAEERHRQAAHEPRPEPSQQPHGQGVSRG